ncbi:hypothetical protein OG426_10270 [Streptomyces canus]|uniref:hypothetical protein n=1 Tax=Streptomyces canus TaxID=58343 RepID=UPI00225848A1|nr:hypothetical protein [Streptomyces canus]MCX4862187.1 hypothetical protein [Streptomyces canus]WSW32821.1 hypothetical protein OG426_10270 [Streptomyces canus]
MNVPVRAAADLRLLRAAMFSAVCVTLSAAGHVVASGTWIPLWSLAAGWAGVLCVVGPLAGRERSLSGIALTLLTGEIGLHLLYCLGQSSATSGRADDRSSRVVTLAERLLCGGQSAHLTAQQAARVLRQARIDPARAADGAHTMSGMAGMAGQGAHTMSTASMLTLPMLAAHLAAAVVTGWLLRRCEVALWGAVRLPVLWAGQVARLVLLGCLSGLLSAARLPAVAALLELLSALTRHRAVDDRMRRPRAVGLLTCVIRRGPPAMVVAA